MNNVRSEYCCTYFTRNGICVYVVVEHSIFINGVSFFSSLPELIKDVAYFKRAAIGRNTEVKYNPWLYLEEPYCSIISSWLNSDYPFDTVKEK